MTLFFYVKTLDTPKNVGQIVCDDNSITGEHPGDEYSWIMEIDRNKSDYWKIRGKYSNLDDLTQIANVYRIGDTIVLGEIDNALVSNFVNSLIEKYGFDNVKWLLT